MGTGTPTDGFECDIYLPRQQPDRDWIISVCHTLWQHGMTFLTPHMLVGTWEEQLQTFPPLRASTGKPLTDQIDEIVKMGFGELSCYDHGVELDLRIDTDLRSDEAFLDLSSEHLSVREPLSLGRLELYVRYPYIDTDHRLAALPADQVPLSAYLIPPYQQIHLAMLHWLEILSQKLQPAFAVGYYVANSYFASEDDFLYNFDVATITALEQQQLPALQDWLKSVYVLYTPTHLKTSPQTEAWLSSLSMWKRQLPDGSSIAYTMPETPDEIRIKDFNAAAKKLLDKRDRAQFPLARVYLQRAQEISAVAHIPQKHYRTTTRLLEQIAYMEEHPEIFFE